MLRTVRSLPLTGLSTLGFGTRRFPLMPPACYRASWQLPGPDFHRPRPLTSHEVIINTIAATTTKTGLTITAELDTGTYPTGIKITDREMKAFEKTRLNRHHFHGNWNYTIHPATTHGDQPSQDKHLDSR